MVATKDLIFSAIAPLKGNVSCALIEDGKQ